MGRRGQHRNSYGSFYHKKQEKVMGYGAHISPDQEKQFRLLTRYRDEGTPKVTCRVQIPGTLGGRGMDGGVRSLHGSIAV